MDRRAPDTLAGYRFAGLGVAALILAAWAAVLGLGLTGRYAGAGHPVVDGAWILLEAFAYTGLFITAHDAMHGLVAPAHPRLNHAIGGWALTLYGVLPYTRLRAAHQVHHRAPSTTEDPDYHEGPGGFLRWFVGFIGGYATVRQVVALGIVFNVLHHGFGFDLARLWLFWLLPLILSALQLFTFGTWLPHREGAFEGEGPTKTRSLGYPAWLSFLACYHFGYHYEHHAWPFVPWWRLPRARASRSRGAAGRRARAAR
jgi:beta-carotene ketolase (CrtW type)